MEKTITFADISGEVRIPASKSHTIRALTIATLAEGTSHIRQPLESADTRSCLNICRQLGAGIEEKSDEWIVTGTGGNLSVPDNILDTGNSGTTLYIAASTAALVSGYSVFTGDEQIRRRPIDSLLAALKDLGADAFSTRRNGCAPVVVRGRLQGGKTAIKCPTSQYLTSLLLNCPLADGDTEIQVLELNEKPYVEITLFWLDSQGIKYERDSDMNWFRIPGGQKYRAFDREIPADFSSATFFLCLGAIKGGGVTLHGLDMNDPQGDKAVIQMLQQLGTEISVEGTSVSVKGGTLKGTTLDLNATPDALPALAVTACFAEGTTCLVNVPQARLKETDRIAVMAAELSKMGAKITEKSDGLIIQQSKLSGAAVHGHADHRVVMSLAVAGLNSPGETIIDTAESVNITFPQFFSLIDSLKK